jgi:hypothetical protein
VIEEDVTAKPPIKYSRTLNKDRSDIYKGRSGQKKFAVYLAMIENATCQVHNALDPFSFDLCINCKSPREIFKVLSAHYFKTDQSSKLSFLSKIWNHKMENNSDPVAYFKTLKEMHDDALNYGIDKSFSLAELYTWMCMENLPSKYSTVVTVLESNASKNNGLLNIEEIEYLVVSFDKKQKKTTKETPEIHGFDKERQRSDAKYCIPCKFSHFGDCPVLCSNCDKKHYPSKPCFCKPCGYVHRMPCYRKKEGKEANQAGVKDALVSVVDSISSINDCGEWYSWYLDSGANVHVCKNADMILDPQPSSVDVRVANNTLARMECVGNSKILLNKEDVLNLRQVYCLPTGNKNLISVSQLVISGFNVNFGLNQARIIETKTNKLIATATKIGGLYKLNCIKTKMVSQANSMSMEEAMLHHQRCGHMGLPATKEFIKHGHMKHGSDNFGICKDCEMGKSTRSSFKESASVTNAVGDIIVSDVKSYPCPTWDGFKYFISFMDVFSGYSQIVLLKHKSESLDAFKRFLEMFKGKFNRAIKTFRSDNGGEYVGNEFQAYLSLNGIEHETTIPYSPQQNGIAERLNRTIDTKVMTMKHASNAPNKMWGELVKTANFLRNRTPYSKIDGRTPFELWNGKLPNVSIFRVFGADMTVHIPQALRKGLEDKAFQGKLVGYSSTQKAYMVWNIEKQRVEVANIDSKINEKTPTSPWTIKIGNKLPPIEIPFSTFSEDCDETDRIVEDEIVERGVVEDIVVVEDAVIIEDAVVVEDVEEVIVEANVDVPVPRRSNRLMERATQLCIREEEVFDPCVMMVSNEGTENVEKRIPESFKEAMESQFGKEWLLAMIEEHQSIIRNSVFELVDPSVVGRGKVLSTKWVLSHKTDENGKILKYKARFCVRGCHQVHGRDYFETFSPMIKMKSIRIILAMANKEGWDVHQMDVKTAYLHSPMGDEIDIYVHPPEGFKSLVHPTWIWKLKKALYGLKQSARKWWLWIQKFLLELGCIPFECDPCIFMMAFDSGIKIFIGIYVDDIQITGSCNIKIDWFKKELEKEFSMKDMGLVGTLLGMEVKIDKENKILTICSYKYIREMLKEFGLSDLTPRSIPMDPDCKLRKSMGPSSDEEKEKMQALPVRGLVGSLMYLSMSTRPDITFAVGEVSRFVSNPGPLHWEACIRICNYLKGTMDWAVHYDGKLEDTEQVVGFSDSDWARDEDERKSRSAYFMFLYGGPVSWRSKLQSCVSQSSTKAEYVSANEAGREIAWVRQVQSEFGYKQRTTKLFEDNQPCIAISNNPIIHDRVKHIDIKYHWIRKEVTAGNMSLIWCPTADMTADILTKPLGKILFEKHRKSLGMRSTGREKRVQFEGGC